jgi:hypothetical protein
MLKICTNRQIRKNRERSKQATSNKQQATSNKQQATSNKQQATSNEQQATSNEQRATSNEQQATSNKQQATSNKQRATSKSLRSQATQLLFKEYRYTYRPELINTTIYDKLPVVNHGGHIHHPACQPHVILTVRIQY